MFVRSGVYARVITIYFYFPFAEMALSVALPLTGLETENFNSFRSFIDIAGLSQSQTSPSPSVSSESSGIGSLGSLKSESVNSDSLPSSPQTTEKVSINLNIIHFVCNSPGLDLSIFIIFCNGERLTLTILCTIDVC